MSEFERNKARFFNALGENIKKQCFTSVEEILEDSLGKVKNRL